MTARAMADRLNRALNLTEIDLNYGPPETLEEEIEHTLNAARIQDTPMDVDLLWLEQAVMFRRRLA